MSVEASAATGEIWAKTWAGLEGRVVNGVFPLRRYLGSSDHSGVFLTEFAKRGLSEVALKLIPTSGIIPDSYLARWRVAGGLKHAHMLRLLEAGRCQLDGLSYLYLVMEYSDQNLAQLLERRALTDDEVREMLPPVLGALAFLHERNFVQGRLTPANVLVVGDQIKLSSDTIRAVGDLSDRIGAVSAHEPPEARDGSYSAAGDVWALGVTLCEALSRQQPSGLHEAAEGFSLPPELSAGFLELVARCLSRAPAGRPTVAGIDAWMRGGELPPAPIAVAEEIAAPPAPPMPVLERAALEPAPAHHVESRAHTITAAAASEPIAATSRTLTTAPPVAATATIEAAPLNLSEPSAAEGQRQVEQQAPSRAASGGEAFNPLPVSPRTALLVVGAVVVILLSWAGLRAVRSKPLPEAPAAAAAPADAKSIPNAAPAAASTPAAREIASPGAATAKAKSAGGQGALSPTDVHQVIPEVPRSARQTIRGHIKVSVRVIVEQDGTVFAALTEVRGPSRYFERLALDAAKKWTFGPVESEGQRLMLLRFDFTRQGTTAGVSALK